MFEHLLGPKLGRITATLLLVAAVLWAFAFFGKGMWDIVGLPISKALSGIPMPAIDVSVDNIEATINSILFILIIYSGILLFVLVFFISRVFKKAVPQRALNQLAEMRNEAINNIYTRKINSNEELSVWIKDKDEWENKLWKYVEENFPKSDYLNIKDLGVVLGMSFPTMAYNPKHENELRFLARRFEIIERILSDYRR